MARRILLGICSAVSIIAAFWTVVAIGNGFVAGEVAMMAASDAQVAMVMSAMSLPTTAALVIALVRAGRRRRELEATCARTSA